MTKLSNMRNIGETLAQRMESAGIVSSDDLLALGSKEAFLKVKSIYPDACINHLYAIEGALQNIRWHHISDEVTRDLKDFFNSI